MADRLKAEERRERVAEMKLRGQTVREIGEQLHVSHTTIVRDIRLIEQAWIERSADVLALAKGREVARLELVIRESWEAWEKSKEPQEKVIERMGQPKAKKAVQTRPTVQVVGDGVTVIDRDPEPALVVTSRTSTWSQGPGNFRFLELIVNASAQIAQILGLNSAAELNVTVQRYITSVAQELGMTPEQLADEIDDVMAEAWSSTWGPAGP